MRNLKKVTGVKTKGIFALVLGAVIFAGTAIAHLSCLFIGPSCYKAQLAPSEIIQSAINGTLLAPVATVFVSGLFFMCALFAISGAGFVKKLPFLHPALVVISVLCLFRGVATIPSSYLFPEMVSIVSILAGFIWFVVGLLYLYGYRCVRQAST